MARFYASIQANRGEATRLGHHSITGHIRGWNAGVRVYGFIGQDGADRFAVSVTGGSNGGRGETLIGYVDATGFHAVEGVSA